MMPMFVSQAPPEARARTFPARHAGLHRLTRQRKGMSEGSPMELVCLLIVGLPLLLLIITLLRQSAFKEDQRRYWDSLPTPPAPQSRGDVHTEGIAREPIPPAAPLRRNCPRCDGAMVQGFIPEFVGES